MASVVNRMPANWFTRETYGLLIAHLRHWSTLRTLDKQPSYTTLDSNDAESLMRHGKLLRMREHDSKTIVTLIRLTKQSRFPREGPGVKAAKGGSGAKTWM